MLSNDIEELYVPKITTDITSGKVAQIIDLSAACADVRYNT